MSDDNYFSSFEDNTRNQGVAKQLKLEILSKLVIKLKQARVDFEQSKNELDQLRGGLYTLRALFADDDQHSDITKKIDEIIQDVYEVGHGYSTADTGDSFNNVRRPEAHGLLRPTLTDARDIAYKIIRDLGSVTNTSKLRDAFNKAGFEVNLNSLRTVLSQNKEIFNFDQEHGGWRLVEDSRVLA